MGHLVAVRGGGDLGTGVAWSLHRAGFSVIVLEIERPLTVRRAVAFSTAVSAGSITVDEVEAVLAASPEEAVAAATDGRVAVLVDPALPEFGVPMSVVVDARVAKEPGDTTVGQAPLVIALGPGFEAGVDCDAVVETNRGPGLGRVIWEGTAEDDTGEPAMIGGESVNRVIRSPVDGPIEWEARIGDQVTEAQPLGRVGETVIGAPISGVVRGLIAPGPVQTGLKVGDIDPRGDPSLCYHISDKSRSVGDGALEAVLTWIDR